MFSAVPFVPPKYLSLSVFHTPAHLHSCTLERFSSFSSELSKVREKIGCETVEALL